MGRLPSHPPCHSPLPCWTCLASNDPGDQACPARSPLQSPSGFTTLPANHLKMIQIERCFQLKYRLKFIIYDYVSRGSLWSISTWGAWSWEQFHFLLRSPFPSWGGGTSGFCFIIAKILSIYCLNIAPTLSIYWRYIDNILPSQFFLETIALFTCRLPLLITHVWRCILIICM